MQNNQSNKRLQLATRISHLAAALVLFSVFYSLTNHYSAAVFADYPQRIHILATALDSNIAFIPAMIVPYSWSLILFIASFFMVRSSAQLFQLTTRLIIATLLACLIFYLYPARFSYLRPLTTDWTAFGYQFLQMTDKPFNQFPSLHVSYALLLNYSLWNVWHSKANPQALILFYRATLTLICTLITVSTVFTYQHHLLDILGGLLLALIVLAISVKIKNVLVLKYLSLSLAGFLLIAIGAFFLSEYLDIHGLYYFAIAFAVYWLASFMLLAGLYQLDNIAANRYWLQKNSLGQLTFRTWLSFAPLLLAYKAMSKMGQIYTNRHSKTATTTVQWLAIEEGLLTAATPRLSLPSASDFNGTDSFSQLIVIDVAAEIDSHLQAARFNTPEQKIDYLYLPLLDLQAFKLTDITILIELFKQVDKLVAEHNSEHYSEQNNKLTLLNFHCVMGFSRSIAVQVLYLLYCDKLTLDEYRAWITEHYPRAHLSDHYLPDKVAEAMSSINTQPCDK